MLALADAANDAGYCWPGYDNLQKKMACKSRGSVTNAIKHQEAIGELYVDHRQQRGNKYLVLVGLSDDDIKAALSAYFEMQQSEIDEALTTVVENRNKSKKQTNGKSLKNRPQKVRILDRVSLKNRLDPSLTVKEPKNIADMPTAVGGGENLEPEKPAEPPTPEPPAKPKRPKSRPKGDTVPAALMNPMKDAIAAAFGWAWNGDNPMTEQEAGQIQKSARSLCKANVKPEQVPSLLAFCRKHYENPGPMALSTNVSKWRVTPSSNGAAKPTAPANPLADAYKRARKDCPVCGGNGTVVSGGANVLCECVRAVAS